MPGSGVDGVRIELLRNSMGMEIVSLVSTLRLMHGSVMGSMNAHSSMLSSLVGLSGYAIFVSPSLLSSSSINNPWLKCDWWIVIEVCAWLNLMLNLSNLQLSKMILTLFLAASFANLMSQMLTSAFTHFVLHLQ